MPAGRPPLDPDIRQARRQESRRRYEAKNLAARRERAQVRMAKQVYMPMHAPPFSFLSFRHPTKIAEMSPKERRRHCSARLNSEHTSTRKPSGLKKKVLATNDVRQARGLPNIAVAQGHRNFPHQDLSLHYRAALPWVGSDSDDSTSSDGAASSWHCGTTTHTRTVAPQTARGISSPPAFGAAGRTVPGALASAPKARS
ncbi:hypothetical protein B0H14DRAFT_2638462 [Mycena olivaceomarginata]|nr:hypothetical protein B0H14DRAFT_2638462 [Mycena olivaceomarginata]